MLDSIIEYLKKHDVEFEEDYPLFKDSKIKIGGKAKLLLQPDTEEKLILCADYFSTCRYPFRIVGAMSNLLPKDDGFKGAIIKTSKVDTYNVAEYKLKASCGCYLPFLFRKMAARGIGGFAELASIPGRIGGSVYGNAGAFGKSISDVLFEVDVFDYVKKDRMTLYTDELNFSYRNSCFKNEPWLILSATFMTESRDSAEELKLIGEYSKRRIDCQPSMPSLGSVFKRHNGIAVSELIDRAGLKGCRVGDAQVSTKHAGFIINLGHATESDVRLLISTIKQRIFKLYDIELEEEIESLS